MYDELVTVLVLIADIIGSKRIEHRAEFQRRLKAHLARVNETSHTTLVSPYTLTLGDEFQAVYGSVDSMFADVVSIMLHVHPVQLRFAFAYGRLTTDINPNAALEMDGPAFNDARALMSTMKSESTGSIQIVAPELHNPDLANACLKVFGNTVSRLSKNNLTIMEALMAGTATKHIAERLAVTPRAVNKAIAGHSLATFVELSRALTREFRAKLPFSLPAGGDP